MAAAGLRGGRNLAAKFIAGAGGKTAKWRLSAIDSAGKLDPGRTDIHYLRGRVLIHMGRKEEGK